MVDADAVKRMAAALGRIPSGLFVLTFCRDTQTTGMLASWVQQCSFDPPQLSLAIQRDRPISAWLKDGAPFVVNVLDSTQTDMIAHFGRGFALGAPAFEGLEKQPSTLGPPILTDTLAYLECRLSGRFSAGDHELLVGRVLSGQLLGDGQPMIHVRKSGLHY